MLFARFLSQWFTHNLLSIFKLFLVDREVFFDSSSIVVFYFPRSRMCEKSSRWLQAAMRTTHTVRSEAEEHTFWGARLDVLIFRLRSYHALLSYIAYGNGPKIHKNLTRNALVFSGWAFFDNAFLVVRSYCNEKRTVSLAQIHPLSTNTRQQNCCNCRQQSTKQSPNWRMPWKLLFCWTEKEEAAGTEAVAIIIDWHLSDQAGWLLRPQIWSALFAFSVSESQTYFSSKSPCKAFLTSHLHHI